MKEAGLQTVPAMCVDFIGNEGNCHLQHDNITFLYQIVITSVESIELTLLYQNR